MKQLPVDPRIFFGVSICNRSGNERRKKLSYFCSFIFCAAVLQGGSNEQYNIDEATIKNLFGSDYEKRVSQ